MHNHHSVSVLNMGLLAVTQLGDIIVDFAHQLAHVATNRILVIDSSARNKLLQELLNSRNLGLHPLPRIKKHQREDLKQEVT